MKTSLSFLSLAALASVSLTACHHHKSEEVAGPIVLDGSKAHAPWITVSLTVAGSGADHNKADDCREEATTAGIALAPGAAIAGTLYFLDHDDYVESPAIEGGRYALSSGSANTECRVALSKIVDLDHAVQTVNADPAGSCRPLGNAEGSDSGFWSGGNEDAAMAEAKFKLHALGANNAVVAVERHDRDVFVHARGFACPK